MTANQFIEVDAPELCVMEGEADELCNDGIYGKALAEYLRRHLIPMGYQVPDVVCEDWGWYVSAERDGVALDVCVYGFPKSDSDDTDSQPADTTEDDIPNLPAGTPLSLCFCVGTRTGKHWSWSRFRKIDRTAQVEALHNDLLKIVQDDPDIRIVGCTEEFPLS